MKSRSLFVMLIGVLGGCASTPKVMVVDRPWQKSALKGAVQTRFEVFGKQTIVRIWPTQDSTKGVSQSLARVKNEVIRIATLADPNLKTSLLSQVNANAFREPVLITPEFLEILRESDRMYRQTEGKFDVTFVPYKLGADEDDSDLNKVRDWDSEPALSSSPEHLFGKKNVVIDSNPLRIRIFNRRTKLNLNGMIRGYAIDRAAKILAAEGHAGYAILADGFFVASGVAFKDPSLMCLENPLKLGSCLRGFTVKDQKQILFFGNSASLERRGILYDPTEVWSARSGGVFVVGTSGAWVQFANTITGVMNDVDLISFFGRQSNPKISGVYFTPAKKEGISGTLSPFAELNP